MTPALQQLLVQARADADAAMAEARATRRHAHGWGLPAFVVAFVASLAMDGFASLLCIGGAFAALAWMESSIGKAQRHAADALARWGGILDAARAGEP